MTRPTCSPPSSSTGIRPSRRSRQPVETRRVDSQAKAPSPYTAHLRIPVAKAPKTALAYDSAIYRSRPEAGGGHHPVGVFHQNQVHWLPPVKDVRGFPYLRHVSPVRQGDIPEVARGGWSIQVPPYNYIRQIRQTSSLPTQTWTCEGSKAFPPGVHQEAKPPVCRHRRHTPHPMPPTRPWSRCPRTPAASPRPCILAWSWINIHL